MNLKDKRILITGGTGFLGGFVMSKFMDACDHTNTVIAENSKGADLRSYREVEKVTQAVDIVIHLAGNVGGIGYNQKYPGTLFYENLMMGMNVIEACRKNAVKKVVMISTVCAYPKFTKVPFREEDLFKDFPEETNSAYGIAKRSLLVMAQTYRKQYGSNIIYLLPVNLYGEFDPGFFHKEKAHVIPDMVRKFVDAKEKKEEKVVLWGSGKVTREFLNVKDCAKAIVLATKLYDKPMPVNIGAGFEVSIKELAEEIRSIVGYNGNVEWDTSKPDGQPRRCLDTSKAKKYFNFEAEVVFKDGLREMVSWYLEERSNRNA